MKEAKSEVLYNKMNLGVVYRRSVLTRWSRAVDRNLEQLVSENKVLRLSPGLYMRPKATSFGALPADDKSLVESFLKDKRFLLNSYNNYTQLGLGLTQLYNTQIVYNYKRHGEFELGGKKFFFKRIPKFPRLLSKEYLLIDLLNNLKYVAEDQKLIVEKFLKKKADFDSKKVLSVAREYGRPFVRKFLEQAYKE